jgi:DNA polymerase III delta subunit
MLYVFHGSDRQTAAKKAHTLIDSLRAKKPDAAFEKIDGDSWSPSVLEGHLGGQGLFSSKYIVFLDRVTENTEAKERIPSFVPAMQESPNIFIVLEGKLNAELKKGLEKDAEKVVGCEPKTKDAPFKKDEFNIFALANAVGRREPLKAWSIYRQAVDAGIAAENILGILFWKAKSMSSPALARDIVILYHEGHRGARDLELGLERMLLMV